MRYLMLLAVAFAGCSQNDGAVDTSLKPLEVRCAQPEQAEGDWRCGEERTVECTHHEGGTEEAIYVEGGEACDAGTYQLNDPGPYSPGDHTLIVSQDDAPVCQSVLHVVDTTPPVAHPRDVQLWSPNHKWHTLAPADCVDIDDACDADVEVHFTWATSDEVEDGQGDGHTHPDIEVGCDTVRLRAERSGGGDGRVYQVGFIARDDAGNTTEGACTIHVPHDQGGHEVVDSGEAVRVPAADCE